MPDEISVAAEVRLSYVGRDGGVVGVMTGRSGDDSGQAAVEAVDGGVGSRSGAFFVFFLLALVASLRAILMADLELEVRADGARC